VPVSDVLEVGQGFRRETLDLRILGRTAFLLESGNILLVILEHVVHVQLYRTDLRGDGDNPKRLCRYGDRIDLASIPRRLSSVGVSGPRIHDHRRSIPQRGEYRSAMLSR